MRAPLVPTLLALGLLLSGCVGTATPTSHGPRSVSGKAALHTPAEGLATPSLPGKLAWRALADAPLQRNEVCATNVGSKFYVIGGYINVFETSFPGPAGSAPASVPQSRVDIYDATTNTWSTGPDFPSNLDHCLAYTVDGVIYVVSHGQKLDPKDNKWVPIAPSPQSHAAGAGGVIDGKIYVTGGGSKALDVYDPATNKWQTMTNPMPTMRGHTSGAVADGKLYIIGGDVGGHSSNTGANEMFDPATGEWTKKTDLPVVRGSLKAFTYFGHILVMGGQNGQTAVDAFTNVNAYDPATDSWSELPAMNHGRHGFDGGVWNDRLWVFLGSPQQGVDATKKADVLEPGQ